MTILACLFYITLGVFLGFICWLVSGIKEAVELKLKKTAKTAMKTKTTVTTKATVTTGNREYCCHGNIVFDPDGNPVGF